MGITVGQLIKQLQKLPKEEVVYMANHDTDDEDVSGVVQGVDVITLEYCDVTGKPKRRRVVIHA